MVSSVRRDSQRSSQSDVEPEAEQNPDLDSTGPLASLFISNRFVDAAATTRILDELS